MSEIVSFGEWVQRRRNQLRYSRTELARQVSCSPVTIKKIERDERRPSVQIAELLAQHSGKSRTMERTEVRQNSQRETLTATTNLALFLFGPPRLERDGQALQIKRRKGLAMLSYLAVTAKAHSRDALATLFWPEHDQTRARANLRRELSALNKILGEGQLTVDREQVALNAQADLTLDVTQFHQCLASCETHNHLIDAACRDCIPSLHDAVTLYSQDFLAGFTLADSPDFDEWQFFQTEALMQSLAGALEKLAQALHDQEDYEGAIPIARRWVELDPLHEPAQVHLMQLYTAAGRQSAAWRQYERYAKRLENELGVSPSTEIKALYDQAQYKASRSQEHLYRDPAPHISTSQFNNLPLQSTPFIGREDELAEIQQLIQHDDDCRLLTLVGPGGIGKTRLALQAASHMSKHFADGVCFIPLAPINDAAQLLSAITEGLNLAFAGGADPKTQLLRYLSKRQLLLVLDNFEHLMDETNPEAMAQIGLISDIAQSGNRLKLLVTSRERLNLPDAWSFEIKGMPFPQAETRPDVENVEALAAYNAVGLFVQHARRVQATFKLTADVSADIVRICRLVGGMPLGLELAAAWVRMMSCREIADEIARNADFLVSTNRGVAERHQSLRAVFNSSWDMLSEAEQSILSQLAIFRGGFLREAAADIADASLLALSSLVDKSLLRRTKNGRYEIHELLRQFAAEKLSAHSEQLEAVQDRHSHFYLTYVHRLEAKIKSNQQNEGFKAIGADMDNIRVAWHRAIDRRFVKRIWHATTGLLIYHEVRSYFREAEVLLRLAASGLQLRDKATFWEQIAYAQVVADHGFFVTRLGQLPQALQSIEEAKLIIEQVLRQNSLDTSQKNIAQQSLARTLCYFGNLATMQAVYSSGSEALEEGVEIFKQLGDHWWCACLLMVHGIQAEYDGSYRLAEQLNQECLHCLDIIGERDYLRTGTLASLGRTDRCQGAYETSELRLLEALQISQMMEVDSGIALSSSALGDLAEARDQYGQSKIYHQMCLHSAEESGRSYMIAYTQAALARLARLEGDSATAEDLSRQSLTLSQNIDDKVALALSYNNLGHVALMNKAYQEAKNHFRAALETTQQVETDFMAADALLGLVSLAQIEGHPERAVSLLTFIAQCDAFYYQDQVEAQQQLSVLRDALPNQVLTAIQEQVKLETVDSVMASILNPDS